MSSDSLKQKLWNDRIPPFVPQWMRRRIEVNVVAIEELMRFAQQTIPAGETVLDAGAGEGRFRHFFAHTTYIGVDFGKGDMTWNYSALDVNGDLLQLPVQSASVDNVVCTQTLEHVRDPQQVICEISRVLKPGGRLFLSAPMMWAQHQQPHDYFRFTSFALRMMFENAGLAPQFVRPIGGYFWFLSFQLQMMHFWVARRPDGRRTLFGLLLSIVLRVIFLLLLPIPLYYLDRLDHFKDTTLGFVGFCVKAPAVQE